MFGKSKKARRLAMLPPAVLVGALVISLLLNIGLISTAVFLSSRYGDYALLSVALDHTCNRDYDWIASNVPTADAKIQLKEAICYKNTQLKIENGHAVIVQ